ncbi:hypothetical protein [Dyella silvae]|uniref:hypothetical protein n=1 Tax=Dyella silvae TaxID=2994424 RepID=UPI002264C821|nr:hypothetical protein [Dyella silvae]
MAFPIGKILMAYRPMYLRGLMMDGHYRLPASTPAPVQGKTIKANRKVVAERNPATSSKTPQGASA